MTDQAWATRDALKTAGITNISERTVSAHSSGGRALAAALLNGSVEADTVVLLDCLYEPAATNLRLGLKRIAARIIVVVGTNEPARADALVQAFPSRAEKRVVPPEGDGDAHDRALLYVTGGSAY